MHRQAHRISGVLGTDSAGRFLASTSTKTEVGEVREEMAGIYASDPPTASWLEVPLSFLAPRVDLRLR